MKKSEATEKLKARLQCLKNNTSGDTEICNNNCDECRMNYMQGTLGEQIESIEIAIATLEDQLDTALEINGIMHFVEKFLTDEEKQGKDNIQKAAFMREKLLRILESSEYENLSKIHDCLEKMEHDKENMILKMNGEPYSREIQMFYRAGKSSIIDIFKIELGVE